MEKFSDINDVLHMSDRDLDQSVVLPKNYGRKRERHVEPVKNHKLSFWEQEGVPQNFKNAALALQNYLNDGDLTMTIRTINLIMKKFVKDTSITDYLTALFDCRKFVYPMPTIMRMKHILVPFTQELTLASNAAISLHINVGMWNATNGNNIYTNILNNGVAPDVTALDYVSRGIVLPAYYSAAIPVATIMTVTPEGNDFNEAGRLYVTSTYDETVRIETPITYSNYTIPAGYINQYNNYVGHPLKGAYAIYIPPNDRFMTYQQIVATSAASLLNGALLEMLLVGSNNVPIAVTITQLYMFKPLPLQTPFVGVSTSKPGRTPSCFDLGSIAGDYPQLITGSLDSLENPDRLKTINEAIMNVPGVETDDFWTGMARLGLIALNAVPSIIEGFK
jgi:hypothetical protein